MAQKMKQLVYVVWIEDQATPFATRELAAQEVRSILESVGFDDSRDSDLETVRWWEEDRDVKDLLIDVDSGKEGQPDMLCASELEVKGFESKGSCDAS